MDLIDIQSKPDPPFNYICHVVDHFTKFYCLFPLISKSADEVSRGLVEKVFSWFGLPKILHSDNGKEFVNEVIKTTILIWPGQCSILDGNPGQSHNQGLVEQGNWTTEMMISAREADTESLCDWPAWLPEVQCEIQIFCYTTRQPGHIRYTVWVQ